MTASDVVALLRERHLTLATCESLTGGLVGAEITSVPGASQVYRGGLVTYASELKATLAGVDADWIGAHGVINAETARQMATGAARACGADVGLATTGVAGPDSQDGCPPGVVWVGICLPDAKPLARRLDLVGNRAEIRRTSVEQSLDLLKKMLEAYR